MISEPLAILAVLLFAIYLSLKMVKRYVWAERMSTILWVIFISAIFSNVGLIPTDAALYGSIIGFTVPFAVCVILLTVSLKEILKAGRAMLSAFVLASIGTVLGVVIATLTLDSFLADILAGEGWKLAGPYTGTFIGGSLNFFALWEGLQIGNPDLLAAANAVDNLSLFPLYALWVAVPTALAGKWVVSKKWEVKKSDFESANEVEHKPTLDPLHVVTLFLLAIAVMAVSHWIKVEIVDQYFPAMPSILIVTTLALILAQIGPIRRLKGAWEIGDLAFFLFFAAVGALINFYQAIILSPILFLYVMIIMVVHFAFLFGTGMLFKMDLGVLTIASVATKGGPAVVLPVAEMKGWRHLVLSGIIIAMLGYAVGNYIGYAVAQGLRLVLGG
ncbi:MAG: DUF819 family protein [Bacteroidetes bacterium]|nr:DUF819 family protein [Bacteroidota bacterium]